MNIRRNFPKLENQDGIDRGKAYVIRARDAIQDPAMETGMFLHNNLYANTMLDFGADRIFIAHKLRQLPNHYSSKLKEPYIVEMANGKTGSTHEILEK